jgi:UDP-glucose:(heptosyl)LPS alpha-1,3-glucosyltransferase
LRLAVVSPFVDRRHGTERALAELLERLARKEHCEIHLYAQHVEGLALTRTSVPSSHHFGAIVWHKIPSIPGPHLFQCFVWLFLNTVCRAWDRWVRGLRFDLVLSPGINCLDADVVIVHVLFHRLQELSAEAGRDPAKPGFFRQLHRRAYYALLAGLERRIYSASRVSLAAVSRRTAKLLSDYFHRQDVRVIPNGVDSTQFLASSRLAVRSQARRLRNFQEGDFVLLLIGNDWRAKGLGTVLRTMGALRELPIHLVVAGDDSPDVFLEMAESLGISERCRFESSREDVLDFYAAADIYVSPSREDSFGLPVLEAMACGLPVVTSRFAGVADLIQSGENGFMLDDPDDSQALAQLLRGLIRDPERKGHIGESAAKTALEWGWDRNAAAIYSLLQDAVAQKRKTGAAG